jgi:hypothetical protein
MTNQDLTRFYNTPPAMIQLTAMVSFPKRTITTYISTETDFKTHKLPFALWRVKRLRSAKHAPVTRYGARKTIFAGGPASNSTAPQL